MSDCATSSSDICASIVSPSSTSPLNTHPIVRLLMVVAGVVAVRVACVRSRRKRLSWTRGLRRPVTSIAAVPIVRRRAARNGPGASDAGCTGASAQVYFERYRTYPLALALAITQQVLEVVGR
jgi:hypothetical protein